MTPASKNPLTGIGTFFLTALLAPASFASYLARVPGWENTADDVLEFPAQKNLTLSIDGRSQLAFIRGTASSLVVGLLDDGSIEAMKTRPPSLSGEIENLIKGYGNSCSASNPEAGRLDNGWESAWAETKCKSRDGRDLPGGLIAISVEGRRYFISGVGFPLPEVRDFAASGRIIPRERRPSAEDKAAMARESEKFAAQVDELSGGPQIRRWLARGLLGAAFLLAWILFRRRKARTDTPSGGSQS